MKTNEENNSNLENNLSQSTDKQQQGKESAPSHKESSAQSKTNKGAPYYYGGRTYGSSPYYNGAYAGGGPGYYYGNQAGNNQNEPEESIFGNISLNRIIRVTLMKWPTLVVAGVLGLAAGFAYFKATPASYKASSLIEINIRPSSIFLSNTINNDPNTQGSQQEIFSTRLAVLKSLKVVKLVAEKIRADYPILKTMTDEELFEILKSTVEFDIQRQSRLCLITVKNNSPEIAQAIANAYAQTSIDFSIQENKDTAEDGVKWLKGMQEIHQRSVNEASEAMLKYRQENQLDPMKSERESLAQTYSKLSIDKVQADTELNGATDLLSILTEIQKDPTKFTSIPGNTPRGNEISEAQKALQNAVNERDSLLTKYTAKHPEVEKATRNVALLEKQYASAISRARETAAANRELCVHKVQELDKMLKANFKRQETLGYKISEIETQLKQLEFTYLNATEKYQAISKKIEDARITIDDSLATVRLINLAELPKHQHSPNAQISFSVGAVVGLIIGFLFILAVDRVEDRITSSDDIRRHMNTVVLSMIPRIPRTKRTDLAILSSTKKFSRIAEAFAGLRGLLESPRYSDTSKIILVVSTQPEEGKTITASNLALSFALSGKKTLLVDFDLRRPRIARIYGVQDKIEEKSNLIQVLANPDDDSFDGIEIPSGFDNLDLVVSAASSSISPANVIGADKLGTFFEWARANYEHVVIDSSPFGLVSDAIRLGAFSDSAIIVCRPNKSRFVLVRHAISSLKESGSNVIGVVVNEVNFNQSNAFTSSTYTSYSNYSKNGKYGGRYGYGYGSYYKRTTKDDVTTIKKPNSGEEEQPREDVLDVDEDEE